MGSRCCPYQKVLQFGCFTQGSLQVGSLERRKRLDACQIFTVNQDQQHAVCLPPPRCDFGKSQKKSTKGLLLLSTNWNLDQFGKVPSQIIVDSLNHRMFSVGMDLKEGP